MFVAKRILIITPDVKFALNAKKALERNGKYAVTIFSSGKAGVDFLRQNAQDVAIIDFRIKDMPGTDMIDHMRAMQPDIGVVAAPDHPAIQDLRERYNIQGIINIPISTRKLVNMLNSAADAMHDAQGDTSQAPPFVDGVSVERSAQMLEFWLADTDDGDTVVDFVPQPNNDISPESSMTFERLKAEEPPMPDFIDGSTIRDLRERLTSIEKIQRALAESSDEAETESGEAAEDVDTSSIPAAMILETALDESTPIRTFSLQEFMSRVSERGLEGIKPLPSWQQEDERYVREPDFLPADIPFPELEEAIEYTGTVTIANDLVIESEAGDLVTDPIEPVQRSHPVEEGEDEVSAEPSELESEMDAEKAVPEPTAPSPPATLPDLAVVQDKTSSELPFTKYDDDDPELAQLATTLTQVALELTADATVLARNGEVVAFAGRLPPSDFEGLLDQLTIEWDKASSNNKSRILFATIPGTGEEFMVSTRQTDVGFTLSLIFSGTRPLHDIRRQSKRLSDALAAMPEPEPEPELPPVDESITRTPITYLWLLRDAETELGQAVENQIRATLQASLVHSGWIVNDVQVTDYVYICGEMPAKFKARETLNDLMQQTAKIPEQDNTAIWDDSYLILQPGREMTIEEIQRFVNFARR